jgi:hypothetical protein
VVHGEVLGEFGADVEELLEGHALGAAAGGAGLPEDVPGLAEVVVLRLCV